VPLPKLIVRVRGSGFPYIRFCKIFTGYVFGSFKRLFFCHLTQNPTELGQTFKVTKWPFAILIDEIEVSRAKGGVNNGELLESQFAAARSGQDLTSLKI